ncbi:MAG TPA: DNA polymerase III subunit alpha [Clostridia bacterium]|nr:DNA polymerase III subunit alpha [Clostridia bacterium]
MVVSSKPLADIAPLQPAAKGVTIIQLDKEFVEDAGLIKLDLISLRTMSAIEDTVQDIKNSHPDFDYDKIPLNDKSTYELLGSGETYGVFQLESPAQRALQAKLGASTIEDVIASVALIRPGPLKGNMVEPYLARRHGREPVTYLHPKLKPILEKTYGVVLFQEQVIEIATAVAGFSPGEADRLRRVMTHARSQQEMEAIGREFIAKAERQGTDPETARTIYSYIQGYASYGFCEAHAAAFGTTAYKTAYLLAHYPAQYIAALLSHQPMGYYPPNTLCQVARFRGISILLPDINKSSARFKAAGDSIRISLKQVHGMSRDTIAAILAARSRGPFLSLRDFCDRVRIEKDILSNLILCGAFDSLNKNRRQLIWQAAGQLKKERWAGRQNCGHKPEYALAFAPENTPRHRTEYAAYSGVPDFTPEEKRKYEYRILGIDVHGHFMAQWRSYLKGKGILSSAEIKEKADGAAAVAAGTILRPHRPPTRSGKTVVFFSLEDEYGIVDVTVFENIYQRYGHLIFRSPGCPLVVKGKIKREGRNVSITASHIEPLQG